MRLGTVLLGFVVLVVALVGGVVALVLTIDPNEYKDELVQLVRGTTGRELVLGGDISLKPGFRATLTLSDVHFANAEWGSRPEMVKIQRFAAQVALLPLIFGELQIHRLILTGADILLETDAEGRGNWELAGAETEGEAAEDGAPGLLLQIGEIAIEDTRLAYRDGKTGEITRLKLDRVRARAISLDSPLDIELEGAWDDIAFKIDGVVDAPSSLSNPRRPYLVKLTVEALDLELGIDGTIAEPATGSGLNLELEVNGRSLAGLRRLAGDWLPDAGPFRLSTTLRGGPTALNFDDLVLQWGRSDLSGGIVLNLDGARPRLNAGLDGKRLDLRELLPEAETAPAEAEDARVFSDEALDFEGLKAIDAKLELTLGELVLPGFSVQDMVMSLDLEEGALSIRPLGLTIAGSRLASVIGIDAGTATPTVALEVKSQQVDLGRLLAAFDAGDLLEGTASVDISLEGRGSSVAQVMAGLQGHTRLLMGEGRARTDSFDLLVGGLSQVMGTLFAKKSEWTVVNCMASDFVIDQGVASSRILLADSEHVTVVGEGDIDLGEETLDLKVSPRSKSPTLNISVPVNVRGTLAEPSFTPDKASVARKIGGVLGAAIFPPAAILGLGEMGSSDNPCLNLATSVGSQTQGMPKSEKRSVVDKAGGAVKDAIEGVGSGIGRGLQRLFGN